MLFMVMFFSSVLRRCNALCMYGSKLTSGEKEGEAERAIKYIGRCVSGNIGASRRPSSKMHLHAARRVHFAFVELRASLQCFDAFSRTP